MNFIDKLVEQASKQASKQVVSFCRFTLNLDPCRAY